MGIDLKVMVGSTKVMVGPIRILTVIIMAVASLAEPDPLAALNPAEMDLQNLALNLLTLDQHVHNQLILMTLEMETINLITISTKVTTDTSEDGVDMVTKMMTLILNLVILTVIQSLLEVDQLVQGQLALDQLAGPGQPVLNQLAAPGQLALDQLALGQLALDQLALGQLALDPQVDQPMEEVIKDLTTIDTRTDLSEIIMEK